MSHHMLSVLTMHVKSSRLRVAQAAAVCCVPSNNSINITYLV